MPTNTAAWFVTSGKKLEVGPAPYTSPEKGEIVVRNRAVAINPVDWAIAQIPFLRKQGFSWIKLPVVLGEDLAGEVAEVGAGVTRFKVGDSVVAFAAGGNENRNRNCECAFQHYVVVADYMASPIPDGMSFETAAVLPLAVSTASCGLFQKDMLGLQHPSAAAAPTGKTVFITGGATSVGCNAIQLAKNAGYEVFTTASPKNADYLKSLGASQVFDYHSPTLVKDVVAALEGKTCAGALAIATGSVGHCIDIVGASKGDKFVAIAAGPISLTDLVDGGPLAMIQLMPKMLASTVSNRLKARAGGVKSKFIWGGSLVDNEVGPAVYRDFLPSALADGRYVAAPPAQVVGSGLEAIETGFDVQKKGMSAKKVVVSL